MARMRETDDEDEKTKIMMCINTELKMLDMLLDKLEKELLKNG